MRSISRLALALSLLFVLVSATQLPAQTDPHTLAPVNGDARIVTEPAFPTGCHTISATHTIDGWGEPSPDDDSASPNYDNTTVVSALGSYTCVELVPSGSNVAFLMTPFTIPNNVTLVIDAGVTLFASRNPANYQLTPTPGTYDTCGSDNQSRGNGCMPFITIASNAGDSPQGSAIMGYGIIDGRGEDELIVGGVKQSYTWYSNSIYANANGYSQSNPKLIVSSEANNFTLYKITLRNSPFWTVLWAGNDASSSATTGLTVWDAKIFAPYTAVNTDGIDPVNNISNVTINYSYISNGDDNIAISASHSGKPATNISVKNLWTYSGRGISIGSELEGGVSNVWMDDVNQSGYVNSSGQVGDANSVGFRIKSASDRGGKVGVVLYRNFCTQNVTYPFRLEPKWESKTPSSYPTFGYTDTMTTPPTDHAIEIQNTTFGLPGTTTGTGTYEYDGNGLESNDNTYDSLLYLDKVYVNGTPTLVASNTVIDLNIDTSSSSLVPTSGTNGVTVNNYVTQTENPHACSSTSFPTVAAELFASDSTSTNMQTVTLTHPATYTINAVVEPTSLDYTGLPSTYKITFNQSLNGGSPTTKTGNVVDIGSGGNGTLASYTYSGMAAGTYTYTATYPAYNGGAATTFGTVTVTVQ